MMIIANTRLATFLLLLLVVVSTSFENHGCATAFSLSLTPLGVALPFLRRHSRRSTTAASPNAPSSTRDRASSFPTKIDPDDVAALREFNALCQRAIDEERRQHYYPFMTAAASHSGASHHFSSSSSMHDGSNHHHYSA